MVEKNISKLSVNKEIGIKEINIYGDFLLRVLNEIVGVSISMAARSGPYRTRTYDLFHVKEAR